MHPPFGTIDMGRKLGVHAPFDPYLTQCRLSQGLPPYQVVSWSILSFSHNRYGLKNGRLCRPFLRGGRELGPHVTQCRLGRGLPPYQVAP